MLLRALLLLLIVAGGSIFLTYALGAKVLIALGLILTQLQVIAKKLLAIDAPMVLAWLKLQAQAFAKVELIKKWIMSSFLPLLVGRAALRQIEAFIGRYTASVRAQYDRLITWFNRLEWYEKLISWAIVLFALLGLTVSSLGLWLILFSVQFPFWVLAAFTAMGRMISTSVQKMIFRALAFMQLSWAWRFVSRRLPKPYLDRKRRFEFRVARMVVRRRRMTLRQLTDRDHAVGLRLSMFIESFRQKAPAPPTKAELAQMAENDTSSSR